MNKNRPGPKNSKSTEEAGATQRAGIAGDPPFSMFSDVYAGSFQAAMNQLFSARNIAATAQKIIELEKTHGPFQVGQFNRYLIEETALPTSFFTNGGWDAFERDFSQVPEERRKEVSAILRANFNSPDPAPVFYQTSRNVTPTHEVVLKPFSAAGVMHIGVLYLCANPYAPR